MRDGGTCARPTHVYLGDDLLPELLEPGQAVVMAPHPLSAVTRCCPRPLGIGDQRRHGSGHRRRIAGGDDAAAAALQDLGDAADVGRDDWTLLDQGLHQNQWSHISALARAEEQDVMGPQQGGHVVNGAGELNPLSDTEAARGRSNSFGISLVEHRSYNTQPRVEP